MAWTLVALFLLQLAASASAIEPYGCILGSEEAKAAIQVINPKSVPGKDYYVAKLDITGLRISDGKYDLMFKLPMSQIKYERVNSCGISPNDSIMYCLFELEDGRFWLARFDSSVEGDNAGIEYVAEAPNRGPAGGFTIEGDYYLVDGKKAMMIAKPDGLQGKSTPDNTLPKLTELRVKRQRAWAMTSMWS